MAGVLESIVVVVIVIVVRQGGFCGVWQTLSAL
jgi:hypothetical protein